MKKTLKKIFDMVEKENQAPEQNSMEEQETITATPPETAPEDGKLRELQEQLDESRNKYLYLYSDFENFKRHAARERMELIQTAGRDILTALLPVLDDFDRAAKNNALDEGMALIHHKFINTLKHKGLSVIETQAGDDFNPDIHEAVAEIPAAAEELKGKIVDILEPGYSLGERIIRFAKVVVGK
ncbi:MAG: nucleotide exchange factor GrpE [Haliscomenobacteraceae bacterium CHB4]|nr:Protein GrpE [Saprospiraceae bacterium]MCE7925872.1 nucleotide exchange factor GrpE [Haliscomenobacteraceae bacterium CHB4]